MFVLAIDCGTQSLRGIVFDPKGGIVVKEKENFQPYFANEPGYAEQHTEVFYQALCRVTNRLVQQYPEVMAEVEALTLTTQRDTTICVDQNGEPLRPAIIWADQRRIPQPRPMSFHHNLIFRIIGMKKTADSISCNFKGHWIQDHEPEIWDKTYKYLQLSAFLHYKLSGTFVDAMPSQIGHVPFSYKNFRWEHQHSLKHDIFHINNEKFCDLVDATALLGTLTSKASEETGLPYGLKIIAAGSDKGCETLGVGCMNNETIAISLGSQASIQTTTKKYYETLMFIPPFQSLIPGYYNPEIQIYRGYWMVSWFMKEFAAKEMVLAKERHIAPEKILDEELAKIPAGSQGLLLQPYWGAGVKKHEAKGAIIGFNDGHTRLHIYRAIIEGIGFALYEGMLQIEKKSKCRIKEIMISGGGANSDVICQITADLFHLPVYRVQTNETSALGAAMAGYVGLGIHKDFDEAVVHMVHRQKPFLPNIETSKVYEEMYHKLYKKIYRRLKPLYHHFKQFR